MMKALYTFALCLLATAATWAQTPTPTASCFITQPASVAGDVPVMAWPGSSVDWGFGDINTVPAREAFLQRALPDTLGRDTVNLAVAYGNLSGKIAVFMRGGGISFAQKSWLAQRAGAVACVIVQSFDGAPIASLGAVMPFAARVTIPVVLVQRAHMRNLFTLTDAGQVRLIIGNLRGLYTQNLRLDPAFMIPPSHTVMPAHMVRQPGDVRFRVGARVLNFGTQVQSNVRLTAVVDRLAPNPRRLYADSVLVPVAALNDSANADQLLRNFDLVSAEPGLQDYFGQYRLTYRVSAQQPDQAPADNEVSYDFALDRNSLAKAPLDVADTASPSFYRPLLTSSLRLANGGAFKYGIMHRVGSTGGVVQRMVFSATTSEDSASLQSWPGTAIEGEVWHWQDINNNHQIDLPAEVSLLAAGNYAFANLAERGKWLDLYLTNLVTGDTGIALQAGQRYLFLMSYQGQRNIFFSANTSPALDYDLADRNPLDSGMRSNVVFTGTAFLSFAGYNNPALRVVIGRTARDREQRFPRVGASVTASDRVGMAPGLRLWPNPAQGTVRLAIGQTGGPVRITVYDLAGRPVLARNEAGAGVVELPCQSLPAGLYQVEVQTDHGRATTRLTLTR